MQDNTVNYGRRIHIHEILELTPEAYRERPLHSIEPTWAKGLQGTHTYAYCPGFEVLDAVHYESRRVVGG